MAKMKFDVLLESEGTNNAKFRNECTVHLRGAAPHTAVLPSDEGAYHGGDGTAPYPLSYFVSGLTTCLMTQIRAFSRRLDIHVASFDVNCEARWQAEMESMRHPYESKGLGFRFDVDLRGDASVDDKKRLILTAAKGCFVEAIIKPGLVTHRLKVDGEWIALD
ncbi:MAG: OsmC family protein [Pseudomonadota bacterium]